MRPAMVVPEGRWLNEPHGFERNVPARLAFVVCGSRSGVGCTCDQATSPLGPETQTIHVPEVRW